MPPDVTVRDAPLGIVRTASEHTDSVAGSRKPGGKSSCVGSDPTLLGLVVDSHDRDPKGNVRHGVPSNAARGVQPQGQTHTILT
jgi:hypothetical protein